MKEFAVKDHEASWLPEGNWEMVFADEFDGTELDRTTWDFRRSMMQKEWPAWTDKGVHLDGNSNCVFTLPRELSKNTVLKYISIRPDILLLTSSTNLCSVFMVIIGKTAAVRI
jgi:hypothetical protein